MATPCRIIARNVFDLATLTSTVSPLSGTVLDNMKNDRRARVCRFSSSTSFSIKGTWGGQGFVVGGVSLDRFNLTQSATVRFRGWAAADWTGSAIIDTGAVAPYNAAALGSFTWAVDPLGSGIFDGYLGHKYFMNWFTKQTIASFQIDISDTTNSAGYVDIGRVVAGDYLQTTYNASFGMESGWRDGSEQEDTDGGSTVSIFRTPKRVLAGNFENLSDNERKALYEFTRYVGKSKSFLISLAAGEGASFERDLTIPRAKFIELPNLSWDHASSHSMPFSLVES